MTDLSNYPPRSFILPSLKCKQCHCANSQKYIYAREYLSSKYMSTKW